MRVTPALQPLVDSLASHFGVIDGRPIRVCFRPALTASRGKLLSNARRGRPVHAASFIQKREIILESELRGTPQEMARIFIHELFHFAWVRLGNPTRASYEKLIRAEMKAHAQGELGWSAEQIKSGLEHAGQGRPWRVYLCESFCDTAAFLYAGCHQHEEFTLAPKWRRKRAAWFHESFAGHVLSI